MKGVVKKKWGILIILTLSLLFLAVPVLADTISEGVIWDSDVRGDQPNTNYGTDTDLLVKWGTPKRITYIMFNLSGVPASQTINDAQACFYLYNDQGTQTIGAYHVYMWDTQNETTITWNTQPCGSNFDNNTFCNLTAEDTLAPDGAQSGTWQCWNITNMVSYDYSLSNDNISLALYTTDTGNADMFYSREYSNSSLIPYLNVTYSSTNFIPLVSTPSLVPATAYTNDDINCSFTVTDGDAGDNLSVNYTWYNGSTAMITGNLSVVNGSQTTIVLDSGNTTKGEIWNCSVIPYDRTSYGIGKSAAKTVQNSLPTAPIIDVIPDSPNSSDDLVASIITSSTDADNDAITYSYAWYKNNSLQGGLTTNTVSNLLTSPNENWRCIVTPNDGTGNGATDQDNVTINAAPSDTTAPTISSTSPTNASSLAAGTTSTVISLTTDETAVCRYNTSDEAWENMTQLTNTNSTNNNFTVTGLSDGNTYNYYFLCEDDESSPNRMSSSYNLQFSVSSSGGGGGGGGGGSSHSSTTEEACEEDWSCIAWGDCTDNKQTRTCFDNNECGTIISKPSEIQSCGIVCKENWACTEWGPCEGDSQIRVCRDVNNCGTTTNKPEETKGCLNPLAESTPSGKEITGKTVVNSLNLPNPQFLIPTMLLVISLFALIVLRKAKLSKHMKELVVVLYVSIIVIIGALLLMTFTSLKMPVGLSVLIDQTKTSLGMAVLVSLGLFVILYIGKIFKNHFFTKSKKKKLRKTQHAPKHKK